MKDIFVTFCLLTSKESYGGVANRTKLCSIYYLSTAPDSRSTFFHAKSPSIHPDVWCKLCPIVINPSSRERNSQYTKLSSIFHTHCVNQIWFRVHWYSENHKVQLKALFSSCQCDLIRKTCAKVQWQIRKQSANNFLYENPVPNPWLCCDFHMCLILDVPINKTYFRSKRSSHSEDTQEWCALP